MKSAPAPSGLDRIDWSRPWLAPWRERGEPLAALARQVGLVPALNAARSGAMRLHAGPLRFVAQAELPPGEAYESFIARTACVPTRDNLHDFFNGLAWCLQPRLKRRLNELQAGQLALAPVGAGRGPVRDALTLFDENAALLQAPAVLVDALRRRDWRALFVTRRAHWAEARLCLFGHALLEKLTRPRPPITAHVWLLASTAARPSRALDGLADALTPQALGARPYLPLPVLGVPGWWAANEVPAFYDDVAVFRPASGAGRDV